MVITIVIIDVDVVGVNGNGVADVNQSVDVAGVSMSGGLDVIRDVDAKAVIMTEDTAMNLLADVDDVSMRETGDVDQDVGAGIVGMNIIIDGDLAASVYRRIIM